MGEYSLIEMCCGVPELESSRTDNVAHHVITLVWTLSV